MDIEFNDNYIIRSELRKIYGIGYEKADYISNLIGLGKSLFIKNINKFFEDYFNFIIPMNYDINLRLDSLLKQEYLNKIVIKLKKAIRLSKGLPSRGQGTHGNSKQNKYYLFYKWQDEKEQNLENEQQKKQINDKKIKLKKK